MRSFLGLHHIFTAILVQAALDGVREISLFTRDPKREHTLKIVSALRERTGCKIQLFFL